MSRTEHLSAPLCAKKKSRACEPKHENCVRIVLEPVIATMSFPRGCFPTMITPFLEDGSIDYPTTARLVNWCELCEFVTIGFSSQS
jgi:hypothetical protein